MLSATCTLSKVCIQLCDVPLENSRTLQTKAWLWYPKQQKGFQSYHNVMQIPAKCLYCYICASEGPLSNGVL